jgi:hypothetical protein
VDWTPVAAKSLHDVAIDPARGESFVTDGVQGRVLRYDRELVFLGTIPSPWAYPGAIAFVPRITLGFPPQPFESLLAVAEVTGNRLRLIDLDGGQKTTLTLRLEDENGLEVIEPRIGGLTFVADREQFIAVEVTQEPPRIHVLSRDGRQVRACTPLPVLAGSPLCGGIAYDARQDTVLALFGDGLVRELFVDAPCPPTPFQFALGGLGGLAAEPCFAGGFDIDRNTLILCAREPAAIFRMLTFPFGRPFVRGDFDSSGRVDLTDAVNMAEYLLGAGAPPACQDAADANDDAFLDLADPVYVLFWLFVAGSPPPPEPYPDPGDDPTFRDNLGCEG